MFTLSFAERKRVVYLRKLFKYGVSRIVCVMYLIMYVKYDLYRLGELNHFSFDVNIHLKQKTMFNKVIFN